MIKDFNSLERFFDDGNVPVFQTLFSSFDAGDISSVWHFGSTALGTEHNGSDIDIAVFSPFDKQNDIISRLISLNSEVKITCGNYSSQPRNSAKQLHILMAQDFSQLNSATQNSIRKGMPVLAR